MTNLQKRILTSLVILPLSIFISKFIYVALFSLASYLALVIIISLNLREKRNSFFYLIMSFFTLHISYGMGSLMGIFSLVNKYAISKYIKGDR